MTKRLETGIVQCEDDWPGVFIRGDSALNYLMALRQIIAKLPPSSNLMDQLAHSSVIGLASLLERSNMNSKSFVAKEVQHFERKKEIRRPTVKEPNE